MRIALVSHGLPPQDKTGVEIHALGLARALFAAGHAVELFAPVRQVELPHLALRREVHGGLGITRLVTNVEPADPAELQELPGAAEAFGVFLERTRPDLVHFQHLARLGLSLIEEARQRRIPTIYTAHDFYPANAWYTGLRPDLAPLELADSEATAHCDLGRAWLARKGIAGDTHLGVLRDELDDEQWGTLRNLLDGDAQQAGFSDEEIDVARERRRELDERRRAAFAQVDLLLAPTEYLAEQLHSAGVGALPPKIIPCGIDTGELEDVAPPLLEAGGAGQATLRCGYLGALVKHKGVDVLLDAFEGLEGATLAVFGTAHDHNYLRRLRERADGECVRFMGAYEPEGVAAALAQFDLLIVPSIWPENAPFVIREAFAAGRPVIASDAGALAESVRDGVDGQLVPAGDVAALRGAIEACVADRGRPAGWAAKIAPVRTLAEQVEELEEWYARLVEVKGVPDRSSRDLNGDLNGDLDEAGDEAGDGAGDEATGEAASAGDGEVAGEQASCSTPQAALGTELPEHLRAFAERVAEVQALPLEELLERACSGLDRLTEGCGLPGGNAPWLAALASGSALADRVREGGRSAGWLRSVFTNQESARESLTERASWREDQARQERERAQWLEQTLEEKERALAAEADLRTEAERACRSLAEEKTWLTETATDRGRAAEWLERTLADTDGERERLKAQCADVEEERTWLREQFADGEDERTWLREQVTQALGERDWLKEQLAGVRHECAWLTEKGQADGARLVWLEQSLKERRAECRWLAESLDGTREELAWMEGRLDETSEAEQTTGNDRDRAQAALEAVKQESTWLEGVLEHRIKEIEWLRGSFAALQESGRESDEEHTEERRQWEENLARLVQEAEELNGDLKALNADREALNGELRALRNHELWVRDELTGLARQVTWAGGEGELEAQPDAQSEALAGGHLPPEAIAGRVDRAHRVLRALEDELRWRRGEMEEALVAAARWTSRGVSGELRRRVRSWLSSAEGPLDDGAQLDVGPGLEGASGNGKREAPGEALGEALDETLGELSVETTGELPDETMGEMAGETMGEMADDVKSGTLDETRGETSDGAVGGARSGNDVGSDDPFGEGGC